MSHTKRVAINTAILYIRMAITVSMSLYTTRLVLQTLGAEDFGIFNLVAGTIAMLTFLNASMASATQRFMSFAQGQGDENRLKHIFSVSVILHIIIAFLVIAVLELASLKLFDGVFNIKPERVYAAWMVYQYAAISTFFTIISVPYDAVVNARENMLLFAILGMIEACLKLMIAFFIIETIDDKLVCYGELMALLSILLLVFRIIYCHLRYKECSLRLCKNFDRVLFFEMTVFAGWTFLGTTANIISNYGQGLVLNISFGTSVNAAQAVSSQVSGQLGVFAGNMLRALNPLIVKSEGAGNRKLMIDASVIGSKVGFLLLMLSYVPVMIEMPYLLSIWLNDVPRDAVYFCNFLLLRNLVEQLFITLVASISAVGNIKNFQVVSLLLTPVPLIVSFILFKYEYPAYFLYVVYLVYSVIMSVVILLFSKKLFKLSLIEFMGNVVIRCWVTFFLVFMVSVLPVVYMDDGLKRAISVCMVSLFSSFVFSYFILLNNFQKQSIVRLVSELITKVLVDNRKA